MENIENLEEVSQDLDQAAEELEKYTSSNFWQSIDIYQLIHTLGQAILVFVVGLVIIKVMRNIVKRTMNRTGATRAGIYYVDKILAFIMYFILLTLVANTLGIRTGFLVAVVASIGLALALALRGSLSDLASGIMIVATRPIKVGDWVYLEDIDPYLKVKEIRLFNTILVDRNQKRVIVPNERIMQNWMDNLSIADFVYTDIKFQVAYDTDLDKLRQIIQETIDRTPGIAEGSESLIAVSELGESGIEILVSVGVKDKDYISKRRALMEDIFKDLKIHGIEIPYPQLDLRLRDQGEQLSQD